MLTCNSLVTPGQVSPHLHQIIGGVSGLRDLGILRRLTHFSAERVCISQYGLGLLYSPAWLYRFNLTMDASLDLPELSTCTTCRFKEDFSNYWTAVMYFKHPNGSYFRVSLSGNCDSSACSQIDA
jgi:hypothetical protein